jgi:hypothetical protein
MKNIYLIPTDKPSRLYSNNGQLHLDSILQNSNGHTINQHIYITIYQDIKDDNFFISLKGTVLPFTGTNLLGDHFKAPIIILTTDPDLIKDGVQAIDDDFLEWFVKNPSCEEVEYVGDDCYYEIIIPQEEPKQSSNFYEELKKHFENTPKDKLLEEWEKSAESDKVGPTVEEFLNNSKQETLEEAAERLYPYRDDRALKRAFKHGAKSDAAKDYWFEQFKKNNL